MTTPQETTAGSVPADQLGSRHLRRVLLSSFLGSAIEFYDFVLYATAAAIVFGHVFFTGLGPGLAAFASFGTLAAGYVARPLGGIVFGHFGDRIGRKRVLVVSMLTMGLATTMIGLLPSSARIGAAAPAALIVLRVLQGFAVGGEWGGAMTIALEHAPGAKRGFAASFANLGGPAGAVLASGAVTLASLLPDRSFLSWGWRIPFLLSIVLVGIGLWVRSSVEESPFFRRVQAEAEKRRMPLAEVFAGYSRQVVLGLFAGLAMFAMMGIATMWAVNFAVDHGASRTGVLNAKTWAAVVMFAATVASARLSDRVGRKPVMIAGVVAMMAFAFPMLRLVGSGSALAYAIAVAVGQGLQGVVLGPYAAFLAELFPTRVRFTGASLCYQGASTLWAGFTPAIATSLVLAEGGGTTLLGAVWIGALALCLVAVLCSREGRTRELPS
ncbi:MFS transporter [Amycolatopsis sp. VS8301801F10]|uniref:MFS transporter n=1 Tax=Amycolatopsis sp. VS8301801F10 TaxID=2652442 RepID=UPI0038FC70BB